MKIIKSGTTRRNKPWIGKKIECDACGCKFQLEASDRLRVESDRDGSYYRIKCPDCKSEQLIDTNVLDKK